MERRREERRGRRARGRRWDREDGDRALRRWREDEGEMEIDGSEEEVGLGLGLDRWADLLGGPIGQLGCWALFSLSLIF